MEKKNILIVSRSFYPQNSPRAFRTTELALELARNHKVTVIIPLNDARREFGKINGITMKALEDYKEEKLEHKKGKISLLQRITQRIKEQYFLYPQFSIREMVFKSLKSEKGKNYDLLISIAAPHPIHWGVAKALKKYQNITKCWVADCGDPFMLSHNMQYNRPFYFQYFEKEFCKRADYITIPTDSSRDGYYPEFQPKLKIIPQGFNFDTVKINDRPRMDKELKFGYAGSLIKNRRDPSELLSYLKQKDIIFKFYIYSKNKSFAEDLSKKFSENIVYKGEVERLALLYHLSSLDFVLNFENSGTNQTPSKLIDYAIIGKPILSVKFGSLNTPVVDEFIERNFRSQLTVENLDQYRIENVAQQFLELCE